MSSLKKINLLLASILLLGFLGCQSDWRVAKFSKKILGIGDRLPDQTTEAQSQVRTDWLFWRGPSGTGYSQQNDFPMDFNQSLLWTHEIQGGGVPVVAGGRMYQFGYYGTTEDLQEALVCFDSSSGKVLWERRHSDFISDIVYNRYGVGAACVDPSSGNVFFQTSPGVLVGYDRDGSLLWERSLMEEFARLTFPNGRTGGPCVDENLVIIHAITANWGKQGPARDRFYAFDKETGKLVWVSTPGITPKDSSFAPLIFEDLPDGRRVFYSGTGCGHVVCIDARTGQPLWRFQMSYGGVNAGVVIHEDTIIAVHGKENIDTSVIGRMVAIRKPRNLPSVGEDIMILGKEHEVWRNNRMESFTSTPVYNANRLYCTIKRGELICLDANTGKQIWHLKLAPDQIHASPTMAGDTLFVPMFNGKVFIVKDEGQEPKVLSEMDLGSACLAAPAIAHGKVFVQSKKKLYCFGAADSSPAFISSPLKQFNSTGPAVSLQVVPAEFALLAGKSERFEVFSLDSAGRRIEKLEKGLTWEKWVPPTAKVQSKVDATISQQGILTAEPDALLSAGAIKVSSGSLSGVTRGRVIPNLPYNENFEDGFAFQHTSSDQISFSYPPLPWLGARMRWQVQKMGENTVAGNTLDRVLFQRAINFLGHKDMSNYTMEADVMTDGDRRIKSNVGLINQRYIFVLVGNSQKLEVVSNFDRFRHSVPFSIRTNTWYRLKTRVDLASSNTGVIKAKVWPKEEEEPDSWTLEVEHTNAHVKGAPGIYAMSPQSKKKVYIDNISISQN
ncbi:MAG: PQQ-binding-like beta-propeller repeat protein [Verrucomicrobiota bacterium]|nr:PQQ-binding-like beta-propeller repeat protein [Verrucomicrobiota bacterium]